MPGLCRNAACASKTAAGEKSSGAGELLVRGCLSALLGEEVRNAPRPPQLTLQPLEHDGFAVAVMLGAMQGRAFSRRKLPGFNVMVISGAYSLVSRNFVALTRACF